MSTADRDVVDGRAAHIETRFTLALVLAAIGITVTFPIDV